MAKRAEILKVKVHSLLKQSLVVDSTSGKFTAVSLIPYHQSSGFIVRESGNATFVGYCVESPKKVLERAFKDYYVTRYNGCELFSRGDIFDPTIPMFGLGISPIESPKVYGIQYNGRLEDLLQLNELLGAKRDKPVSHQEVQRILAHLNGGYNMKRINQDNHDIQEIIDVVKRFG